MQAICPIFFRFGSKIFHIEKCGLCFQHPWMMSCAYGGQGEWYSASIGIEFGDTLLGVCAISSGKIFWHIVCANEGVFSK
jgi:hypothetical protein